MTYIRLVKKTLSGDEEAFAELVRKHKRIVFGIVAKFVRNNADLEDICQYIFMWMVITLLNLEKKSMLEVSVNIALCERKTTLRRVQAW